MIRTEVVLAALESWQNLNERIKGMNEEELYSALNTEMSHDRRRQFVIRLHARHTKIKAKREREELLAVCQ